jgi:hypothetical protein
MEINILVLGKMIFNMVLASNTKQKTEQKSKVNGRMVRE